MNKENFIANYPYQKQFKFPVTKIENNNVYSFNEDIIGEYPLALILDDEHINTFLCTPENLKELVVGYLKNKGYINSIDQLLKYDLDFENRTCHISINKNKKDSNEEQISLNPYDFLNASPVNNTDIKIKSQYIYKIMKQNLTSSKLFKDTGGVHSVAIFDNQSKEIISIEEDVARHNAMDKVIGYCVLNNISLKDKIILVSGRISCEMISKAAKSEIPIVISKSAPTNLSIEISKKVNISLVGFVRGERMCIYSNPERIIF